MQDKEEKSTVGMLLDIEHLYGEHEGRLAPFMWCLCIIAAPVLLYVYFSWFNIVPVYIAIFPEIFLAIRTIMIIPGREKYRVSIFKKQLFDSYTSIASLMNIKTIHPDGCVEYVNGKILYLVCCFNRTVEDTMQHKVQLRKLLENMLGDYEYDTYIPNITTSEALREYYDKIGIFGRNEAAKNFMEIVDHTIELTENTSVVQCTIYAIKGSRSDWKVIKQQIDTSIKSRAAKCYKSIYRVSDPVVINEILNRDIDGIVNIDELVRKKYSTQQYGTSKVLVYDLEEDAEVIQGKSAANPIIPKQTKSSFHVTYKEE